MENKTKEQLLTLEAKIIELYDSGELPYFMHMCGGNEDQLIEIFKEIKESDYIFSTHRSHYHYMLAGVSDEVLIEKIDRGDSMFIFDKKLNFLSSSILAGTCGIAAGVALALKMKKENKHVWCFIGDGAEDEGHFYEAVKFVQSNNLPCTFIIEDNNRSVESSKEDRGSTYVVPWPSCVRRYTYNATYPHSGTNKWITSFNSKKLKKKKL
jgi:pyruvate dehydrogenase E1 component alpha subunit